MKKFFKWLFWKSEDKKEEIVMIKFFGSIHTPKFYIEKVS